MRISAAFVEPWDGFSNFRYTSDPLPLLRHCEIQSSDSAVTNSLTKTIECVCVFLMATERGIHVHHGIAIRASFVRFIKSHDSSAEDASRFGNRTPAACHASRDCGRRRRLVGTSQAKIRASSVPCGQHLFSCTSQDCRAFAVVGSFAHLAFRDEYDYWRVRAYN